MQLVNHICFFYGKYVLETDPLNSLKMHMSFAREMEATPISTKDIHGYEPYGNKQNPYYSTCYNK